MGKESTCNAGDTGGAVSIPGLGRSPAGGHGNPLQCSCWRMPWTEEPGGIQSVGSKESDKTEGMEQVCRQGKCLVPCLPQMKCGNY